MKVLIVDDHVIVSRFLRSIVQAEFQGVGCIDVQDGESAIAWLKKECFELVILDITLPDMDGATLARWILARMPGQKVIFFSNTAREIYYERLVAMGVSGYISKQCEIKEIARALHLIVDENQTCFNDCWDGDRQTSELGGHRTNPFADLSIRELSVAQLLAVGRTLPEISQSMGIEASTIRTYKSRIFKRLQVANMNDFLKLASTYNLI